MSGRLPTHLLVGAMLRHVNGAGGLAVVRTRGDGDTGTVLVLVEGEGTQALERGTGPDGAPMLVEARATDAPEPMDDYWRRRRARDPDLWVIEMSGAGVADALAMLV